MFAQIGCRFIFTLIMSAIWFSISFTLFSIFGQKSPFENIWFISTTVAPIIGVLFGFSLFGPSFE